LTIERNDYRTYRADLRTAEGKSVLQGSRLRTKAMAGKAMATLQVPADSLTSGDYILTLSGVPKGGGSEVVAEYSFRVVRK